MAFTITGIFIADDGKREQVEVTWNRGKLSGYEDVVNAAQALVDEGIDVGYTVTGPFEKASLDTPLDAFLTLRSLFFTFEATGDVPTLKVYEVPPGAVA